MSAEEENMFQAEANAFQRTGLGGLQKYLETVDNGEFDEGKRKVYSPRDTFVINCYDLFRKIQEDEKLGDLKLTEGDLDRILSTAIRIPGIKYKNYAGFIMGYIVTEGKNDISRKKFDWVSKNMKNFQAIDKFNSAGVELADIIRYCRFWIKYI